MSTSNAYMHDPLDPRSGYEEPKAGGGRITKFEVGTTDLRILSPGVPGWLYWTTEADNKRQPHRCVRIEEAPPEVRNAANRGDRPRHFFAFVVWNHTAECLQVCEVSQKTIRDSLRAIVTNKRYGNPMKPAAPYDISVTRVGTTKDDTEYHLLPGPALPLPEGVVAVAKRVDLGALFVDGADPFADVDESQIGPTPATADEIADDDIPF